MIQLVLFSSVKKNGSYLNIISVKKSLSFLVKSLSIYYGMF